MDFYRFLEILESSSPYATSPEEAMRLLGLRRGYGEQDLERAYRTASMRTHPDKGGDAILFKKIQAAYEILRSQTFGKDSGRGEMDRGDTSRGQPVRDWEDFILNDISRVLKMNRADFVRLLKKHKGISTDLNVWKSNYVLQYPSKASEIETAIQMIRQRYQSQEPVMA